MSIDWTPGIRAFCAHWSHADTLQQTFQTLEAEFERDSDACIDAAKGVVECACRVLLQSIDDPASPHTPKSATPSFGEWLSATVRALELGDVRDESFKKLVSQYHKLTTALDDLRNKAGTVSHGKDGFIAKLSAHQRRVAVLAADAIVTFLHEAYLEREPDPVLSLEPYERFAASNALIDGNCALVASSDEEGNFTVTVSLPGGDDIELVVTPSQLLFGVDREAYKLALNACREATPREEEAA